MIVLLLIAAAATATVINLFVPTIAALWVLLAWAVCGLAGAYLSHARWARIVSFNAGAVALILAIAEAASHMGTEEMRQDFDPPTLVVQEPTLGHRAAPRARVRAHMTIGDRVAYDVIYTTDAHGLRSGPAPSGPGPIHCGLFFGCSYTFGEGLNDEQTMPYNAEIASKGRYRALNYGFLGYGPHHMLAAIESGWVAESSACEPKHAIYWAHPHHVLRAAEKWWWDDKGPRYVLQSDGTVKRDGNFEQSSAALSGASNQSNLVRRLRDSPSIAAEDFDLYFALVRSARDALVARYPQIEFHVLLWDDNNEAEKFAKGWRRNGLTLHRLSQILPDWERRQQLYVIADGVHPNALADRLIGEYVATHIFEYNEASSLESGRQ